MNFSMEVSIHTYEDKYVINTYVVRIIHTNMYLQMQVNLRVESRAAVHIRAKF